MNRYGKRCVLYPRVSTEMQVDGYSLEEMIVVDTYEDAGKSIEGRPAFQKCSKILRMAWTLTIF